ncbi:hypothetical protein FOZ62_018293 [Perkinsus olseni]|uniref:Glutamate decarboxylase 2 n=1 Tax=Perkinsus olseni TaxID=32597 RepID=A0A7J6TK21_PEROL|nr:hypothetical protein FOZ62_018293 [Perkinsus olseni]
MTVCYEQILTEMEAVMMDGLAGACGFSEHFLHSSGKVFPIKAIVTAARVRKRVPIVVKSNELAVKPVETGSDIGRSEDIYFEGLAMMIVYASTESQLALKEACATARITLREDSSLNIRDLQEMIKEDKNQCCLPVLCIANLATEYTGGSGSLAELGRICQKEGMWLHVDASFSAGTLLLDEYERDREEINKYADSINLSGSSWLPTGLEMELLWLKYFRMNELRRNVQRRISSTGVIRRIIETDPQLNDELAFPVWPARFGNPCFTSGSILPAAALDRLRERGITASIKLSWTKHGRSPNTVCQMSRSLRLLESVIQASAGERHSSFAEDGRLTIDFIARQDFGRHIVLSKFFYTPRYFESLEGLADVEEFVVSGMCHWQHPKFLAFFPAKTSTPAIFSEVIAAALNRASADNNRDHLIENVMDALGEAFGLGEAFLHSSGSGGGLVHVDSTSSSQTNVSSEKACRVAGVRLRKIAYSRDAMGNCLVDVALMKKAIAEDRHAKRGLVPILCIANYGTTNTCAIDPLQELGRFAYSGVALLLDSFKEDAALIRANVDSVNISGHKWLGTGLSAGFLWVRVFASVPQVQSLEDLGCAAVLGH